MAIRKFHWSSVHDCVMHETDGSGNTLAEFTHELSPYGPLVSESRNGHEYVHHYDALGSTTMLTDETGNVTDTFAYDAWGNQVARTGTTDSPYRWVGRIGYQYDESTGSYYIRARVYEPMIARWACIDTLSIIFFDVFLYCNNTPITLIDASGLLTVDGAKHIVQCLLSQKPDPVGNIPQGTIDPTSQNCRNEILSNLWGQAAVDAATKATSKIMLKLLSYIPGGPQYKITLDIIQTIYTSMTSGIDAAAQDLLIKSLSMKTGIPVSILNQIKTEIASELIGECVSVKLEWTSSLNPDEKAYCEFLACAETSISLASESIGNWVVKGGCTYTCKERIDPNYKCCCGTNLNFVVESTGSGTGAKCMVTSLTDTEITPF